MTEKRLPRTTPESVGVPSAVIGKVIDAWKAKGVGVHGLMFMRHGKVFAEGWYDPYRPELTHMLFSLSKSFTSTAIGFAVQEGLLTVEDYVADIFADKLVCEPCANMRKMQVKHLLTMNTGHSKEPNVIFHKEVEDWVKRFMESYVDHEPGTLFVYNTAATYMLSAIITKLTGKRVGEYLTPRLFEPLGIEGWRFETCPAGIDTGGYGLNVHLEDIAKFGTFLLNRGSFGGEQLLNPEWIDEATARHTYSTGGGNDWIQGYGYQFWRCQPEGVYRGDGAYGQYCIVVPKLDMVIAMNEGTGWLQDPLDVLWEVLLPAVQEEALAEDPAAVEEMNARLSALTVGTLDGRADADFAYAGVTYELSPNALGIKAVSVEKNAFTFETAENTVVLPFAYAGFAEAKTGIQPDFCNSFGFFYEQAATNGVWKDDSTLALRIAWNTTPFIDDVTLAFDECGVVVEWERNYSMAPEKAFRIFGRKA